MYVCMYVYVYVYVYNTLFSIRWIHKVSLKFQLTRQNIRIRNHK